MQSIKVWHPDIMEFIECKWKEEQKAHALIREGYESNFNGEAYSSVMFQNANLSVRMTDDFMEAVKADGNWKTRWISDKCREEPPTYKARDILNRMADCAWHCESLFLDSVNRCCSMFRLSSALAKIRIHLNLQPN
jgi:ribonucleoside-diphosphate reductase alpha chain